MGQASKQEEERIEYLGQALSDGCPKIRPEQRQRGMTVGNSQVTNSQQVFHLPDTHRVCTLWVCRVKGHGYVLSARSFKISSCKAHAATEGKD